MTNIYRCRKAAPIPACLQKAALHLPSRHLELIHRAAEAYRCVLNTRAIGPDWASVHRAWLDAAESLAIAVLKHAEQQEARRHD